MGFISLISEVVGSSKERRGENQTAKGLSYIPETLIIPSSVNAYGPPTVFLVQCLVPEYHGNWTNAPLLFFKKQKGKFCLCVCVHIYIYKFRKMHKRTIERFASGKYWRSKLGGEGTYYSLSPPSPSSSPFTSM